MTMDMVPYIDLLKTLRGSYVQLQADVAYHTERVRHYSSCLSYPPTDDDLVALRLHSDALTLSLMRLSAVGLLDNDLVKLIEL